MAAEKDSPNDGDQPLLDELVEHACQKYVEVNGEEPPKEFVQDAREAIIRKLARDARDKHRDVYDALADE